MSGAEIAVVDYGAGNILNVLRALEYLGATPVLAETPSSLDTATGIIIPGVGAFGAGMHGLKSRGLDKALRTLSSQQVPILAICLGMQLLASSSDESPGEKGLDLIPGHVLKLESYPNHPSASRIPDTGWATVSVPQSIFGLAAGSPHNFYFSHSYYFSPADAYVVSGSKDHAGTKIPVLLQQDNILASQFHPEKSGPDGIRLMESWINSTLS